MSLNEIVVDAFLLLMLLVGVACFVAGVRRKWQDAGKKIDEFLRRDKP